jgi:hypothetical protein
MAVTSTAVGYGFRLRSSSEIGNLTHPASYDRRDAVVDPSGSCVHNLWIGHPAALSVAGEDVVFL